MRTRIKNTLKLDPQHLEANLMKAEVLSDEHRYEAAIGVLTPLVAQDPAQVTPKLVAATNAFFAERMAARDWHGAQRCWTTLSLADPTAAQQLMLRFLRGWQVLIPRRVNGARRDAPLPAAPSQSVVVGVVQPVVGTPVTGSKTKQILLTVAGAVGGFVLAIVLGVVLSVIGLKGSALGLVALLLILAFPIAGGIQGYKCNAPTMRYQVAPPRPRRPAAAPSPARAGATRISRDELLAGVADFATTQRVANDTVSKALQQDAKVRV